MSKRFKYFFAKVYFGNLANYQVAGCDCALRTQLREEADARIGKVPALHGVGLWRFLKRRHGLAPAEEAAAIGLPDCP